MDFSSLQEDPLFKYLKVPKDKDAPTGRNVLDYEEHKKLLASYREQREALKKAKGREFTDAEDNELKAQFAYASNYNVYQQLYILGNQIAYNKLYLAIKSAPTGNFAESVLSKLEGLAFGQDLRSIDASFSPSVAAVQAFNPAVGKGINRSKPDSTSLAGVNSAFVDWFEEWLRYIGLFQAGNAYLVGDDTKFVCIVPGNLSSKHLAGIYDRLLSIRAWNSMQVDIISVLELAKFLVSKSEYQSQVFGKRPKDVVAGVQTGYFKSLGNSKAHLNSSFIGLPGWFPVNSTQDAYVWEQILEEHIDIIKLLDESKSEQAAMLGEYRDFVSSGHIMKFLRFLATYGIHVIKKKHGNQYVRQFSDEKLRRVVMSDTGYAKVVENPGFKAIAQAIRLATVVEQYYKSKGNQLYEVRYGLLPELKQKARFPEQFTSAVFSFISDYNKENARVHEINTKKGITNIRRRHSVSDEELKQFIELIDNHSKNPEPLAMLLLAFGTVSSSKKEEDNANA